MLIQWSERYCVGVDEIDQQQQRLVQLLNELHHEVVEGYQESVVWGICGKLQRYAEHHFTTKRLLLREAGWGEQTLARYVLECESYRQWIYSIRAQCGMQRYFPADLLLRAVGCWWTEHLRRTVHDFRGPANRCQTAHACYEEFEAHVPE